VQRRRLSQAEVSAASMRIAPRVRSIRLYEQAAVVMIYYPIQNEVSLLPLLEDTNKTILFPKTVGSILEPHPYTGSEGMTMGAYHIPEPSSAPWLGPIDLMLVPGVAFDRRANRLGRGGGYYDRFIALHPAIPTIGVGYDFQYLSALPIDPWDRTLCAVLTPTYAAISEEGARMGDLLRPLHQAHG